MKDDAVESVYLIVPLLQLLHERWEDFVEGQVWLIGMEQEILLNFWDVLTLIVWKADESRQ